MNSICRRAADDMAKARGVLIPKRGEFALERPCFSPSRRRDCAEFPPCTWGDLAQETAMDMSGDEAGQGAVHTSPGPENTDRSPFDHSMTRSWMASYRPWLPGWQTAQDSLPAPESMDGSRAWPGRRRSPRPRRWPRA